MTELPYPDSDAAHRAFAAHVNKGKVETFAALGLDLVIGRREGSRFWHAYDERSWINCHCNGGVFNLGHRHPAVVEALKRAVDELDIGNHHLVSPWRAKLAERLAATTGGLLSGAIFGAAGAEANDVAIKLARAQTGRDGVVSLVGGYHGHTGLAVAAGEPEYREPFRASRPEFVQVPFDDLAAMDAVVDDTTACVLLEPIPATLGMPLPSPDYLTGVARICRERGALLVLDEVQTGLGRTGTTWCWQQDGIEPDLMSVGKGLSFGVYPLSACLARPEMMAVFDEHPFSHISTAGGAELGCAVALAGLDLIEAPGFLERVKEVGERFAEAFVRCRFELRRRGMFMGLKFPGAGEAMTASKELLDRGVFAVWANHDDSVLQFLPPLTITDAEIDEVVGAVTGAFAE